MSQDSSESVITIQTHDKRFHVDDVGAVALLSSYYNQKNIQIQLIRSRDQQLLDVADILVDVGGIYDPSNKRFDHHQDNCNEVFGEGFTIPLSSIGMVWKHYGVELLRLYINSHSEFTEINDWENHLYYISLEVYNKIIQELDGHDNGIAPIDGGKRNYWTYLSLGGIIASMNTPDTNNEENQMRAFHNAVNLFGEIFEIKLEETVRKYFDYSVSYNIVEQAIKNMSDDKEYLIIRDKVPTIYKCLNSLDPNYRIKFLIFNSDDEEHITIRTRNKKDDMFTSIVPLLSYDQTLDKIGGNEKDDLVFVHKALFIAKTKTLELAEKLVNLALIDSRNKPRISGDYIKSVLPAFAKSNVAKVGVLGLAGLGCGYYLLHNNSE